MTASAADDTGAGWRATAARWPQRAALADSGGTLLTYGALAERVDALAVCWRGAGVQAGDVLAVLRPADAATVVALLAAWRLGAVACPLNLRNPPALLAAQLDRVRATALVAGADGAAWAPAGVRRLDPQGRGRTTLAHLAPPDPERPATILFTSGSSAAPKAAVHSMRNLTANAAASNAHSGLAPGDRWLLALPLYHVGGLGILLRCLAAGATVVLPAAAGDFAEQVASLAITHVSAVPTQLRRLLAAAPGALDRIRLVLLGGAPSPRDLLLTALERGWPVRQTYGLTEMGSQVTTVPPGATRAQALTCGLTLPGGDVRVVAAHGEAGPGDEGEIRTRGPGLFLGYLENGRLCRPLDGDGWFATGDSGRLDADGWLTVTGRRDNLFISGGENIQPEEIEAALLAVPGVLQAVVVPVADPEFGSRPVAFVETRPREPAVDALREFLAARLPRYKLPTAFHPWPGALPPGSHKPPRQWLREHAARLQGGREPEP